MPIIRSRRSPVLRLCNAETPKGSPNPRDKNSQMSASRRGLSILLTTRSTATLERLRIAATRPSSSVIPVVPSTTRTIKSESSIAFSLWAETLSSSSLPEGIHPPVSTSSKCRPSHSASRAFRSRVTPGRSSTIASRLPRMRLNKVDFPTLGRPTIETIGNAPWVVIIQLQMPRLSFDRLVRALSRLR